LEIRSHEPALMFVDGGDMRPQNAPGLSPSILAPFPNAAAPERHASTQAFSSSRCLRLSHARLRGPVSARAAGDLQAAARAARRLPGGPAPAWANARRRRATQRLWF